MRSQEQIDIAELSDTRGFQDLRERVRKAQVDYYTNLGREMYAKPHMVTEAALLQKQAFFRGAWFVLNTPLFEMSALARELAKTKDEDE
jgi:hypothetical protein